MQCISKIYLCRKVKLSASFSNQQKTKKFKKEHCEQIKSSEWQFHVVEKTIKFSSLDLQLGAKNNADDVFRKIGQQTSLT